MDGRLSYRQIISGKATGVSADVARSALSLASLAYRAAVGVRNRWYDWMPGAVRRAGVPVISIGNVTTGGTGKTPMTAWVALRLLERARRVAILTRGYRAPRRMRIDEDPRVAQSRKRIESDEVEVLRRHCPDARLFVDADRVAAAQRAVGAGCDVLIMDDGFQHRRLHRDLNLALVDATCPFGYGRLLPRGLLREPIGGLRRADVVIVTRGDLASNPARHELLQTLRRVVGEKPIFAARHSVNTWCDLKGRPVPGIDAGAVRGLLFAGIANFESFVSTAERMGVRVIESYQFPDHHDYTDEELARLPELAVQLEANALLTTEKDAVKLEGRWPEGGLPVLVPRVEMTFDPADEAEMLSRLEACIGGNGV